MYVSKIRRERKDIYLHMAIDAIDLAVKLTLLIVNLGTATQTVGGLLWSEITLGFAEHFEAIKVMNESK